MRAVVDRIEGSVAVIEVDGAFFVDWPIAKLPPGTKEGSVLTLSIRLETAVKPRGPGPSAK